MRTVSLIIPCYNAEEQLEVCLQSILEQTYNDIQLVFVDDGSTALPRMFFRISEVSWKENFLK